MQLLKLWKHQLIRTKDVLLLEIVETKYNYERENKGFSNKKTLILVGVFFML